MGEEATWVWLFDYTSAAAGQTITKNFTIGNALQITSPSHNATIASTPAVSWEAGEGNDFDFYLITIYGPNWWTEGAKSVFTKNNYYTFQSSEALALGENTISVTGLAAEGDLSFSDLDFSQMTLNIMSQNMIDVTVE